MTVVVGCYIPKYIREEIIKIMELEEKWNKLIEIIKKDVSGFEVKDKLHSKLYQFLDKILFFPIL